MPAVYQYDTFPDTFRMQAYYALASAIGDYQGGMMAAPTESNAIWNAIDAKLRREHGLANLSPHEIHPDNKWLAYLRKLSDSDLVIDAIEIAFSLAVRFAANRRTRSVETLEHVQRFVDELNRRFREHDLGYEFLVAANTGFITKIDDQFVHAEVVEPAIASLHAAGFDGSLQEFVKGHQEYRRGNYKSAMNEAHKAFESTMKSIASARGWSCPANPTVNQLIKVLIDNELIPKENDSYFSGLRAILESGTPTLRNRRSAHGQGQTVVDLPDYFALHLTASTIVFLMAAHQALPTATSAEGSP
jgi:hypothetical protein